MKETFELGLKEAELDLALHGKAEEAKKRMRIGSDFKGCSEKLVMKLEHLKRIIQ